MNFKNKPIKAGMRVKVSDWDRKYLEAVEHAEKVIPKIKGMIVAFNTNIDSLHFVRGEKIERLLNQDPMLREETLRKLEKPPTKIESRSDFLAGLLNCMRSGRGAEWVIHRKEISDWLLFNFEVDQFRMGGQAGIMANVLTNLGVPQVYPHVSQLPELQASLFFKKENLKIPRYEGGRIVFGIAEPRSQDKPLIHWIFEFRKGDTIRINDLRITAPSANRFVATWDEKNAKLDMDPAFLEGIPMIVKDVDAAMISGFHMLRKTYPDGSIFRDHVKRVARHVAEWKHLNPRLKIHFEQAYLEDPLIIRGTFELLMPLCDGLGLNEDELAFVLNVYGFKQLAMEIKRTPSPTLLFEGARRVLKSLRISRVVVHTRDFIISLMKPEYDISPETEFRALLFGAIVAATQAVTGEFGTLKDVNETLYVEDLHVSSVGLDGHEELAEKLEGEGFISKQDFLDIAIAKAPNYWITYIATRVMEKPVSTAGLGDSFTAGLLVAEQL